MALPSKDIVPYKYTVGCVLCLGSWLKINERPGTPTVNIKKQKQMKHF
jgi:hypothetical protein